MTPAYRAELDRLLERARDLLGAGDDAQLMDANVAVNHALRLDPEAVDGWLLKCQVASAAGDDVAALAAAEMAVSRAPERAECLYWHGAVLGDLGRHREALRSIEAAFTAVGQVGDHARWLLEDLFFEKVSLLDALGLHEAAGAACAAGLEQCPGSALLRAAQAPADAGRARGLRVIRGGL